MKTHTKVLIAAGAVMILTVGGFFAFLAHADTTNNVGFSKGRFELRLKQLGVTPDQKAEVKTILRKYQPTVGPLIKQVVTERRALRDTIHAATIDETAIRAQAAKVASLESDLAVQRAHVSHDIRAVLTPDQLQKVKKMEVDVDARIDGFLYRVANRITAD
jgi:Spy/CpxP family protein refolding chaperone